MFSGVVQDRVPDLVLAPSLVQETSRPTAIDPAPDREVPREGSHPPRDHGPDQEAIKRKACCSSASVTRMTARIFGPLAI